MGVFLQQLGYQLEGIIVDKFQLYSARRDFRLCTQRNSSFSVVLPQTALCCRRHYYQQLLAAIFVHALCFCVVVLLSLLKDLG